MTTVERYVHQEAPYYFDNGIRLSEGVTYVSKAKTLFWIDIYNALIHKVTDINDISTHSVWNASLENYEGSYPFDSSYPERIGVVFPIDNSRGVEDVYFGAKYGIAKMSYSTGKWEYVVPYANSGLQKDWKNLRSNDGNVSPDGEIFIGIMHDFHSDVDFKDPKGALFKIDLPRRTCTLVLDKIMIPNAINWDKDAKYAYFTDSLNYSIFKFPYKGSNLVVEDKSLFVDVKKYNAQYESPEPDGSFIDPATDNIITAVWSTHSVQRYNTKGELVFKWVFPETSRVSCCALAEGHMFVTTANDVIDKDEKPQGLGGSIYKIPNVSSYTGSSKNNPITS